MFKLSLKMEHAKIVNCINELKKIENVPQISVMTSKDCYVTENMKIVKHIPDLVMIKKNVRPINAIL